MHKKDICELFTKKVVEYINNGYVITPDSFSGSDGTSRVDLVKGDSFIRIFIDDTRDEKYNDIITFQVCKKVLDKYETRRIYDTDVIWTSNMEVIEREDFYVLNKYCNRGSEYYVTKQEYEDLKEKLSERRMKRFSNDGHKYYRFPEQAKEIALTYLHRQPKCKTAKKSDIQWVEKYVSTDNSVYYRISYKDKMFVLH